MDFDRIGKYEIVGKLGQGAMGQVFKAFDPILHRQVAIKTMSAESGADEELRKRFQREAQSAAQLNHPNIITVYDFGEEDGRAYMAMELLEGTDLKNMIGDPRISLDEKMSVMEQICDGLSFAHDRQVVHRDLKPANIHILPNGQAKIMDFGLARLGSSDMTKTGMVMGTPNYMSPEQVRGEKVDVRSDIFSIGAVFYELLTVHKPFQAESMHAVLFQVLENDPEPPRRWVPSLPPVLVDLVEKALSKDPSERFQNAAEMLEAVREARQLIPPEIARMTTSAGDQTAPTVAVDLPRSDPPGMGRTRVSSGRRSRTALGTQAAALPSSSGTVQPADLPRTLLGRAPTKVEGARARSGARRTVVAPAPAASRRSPVVFAVAGVAVLCLAGGLYWTLAPHAKPQETPSTGSPQIGALQAQLAATQLQLAHKSLEDKDYKSAVAQAQQALKLDPGNAEASQLLEKAGSALSELESTARRAREAFDAGDYSTASQALSRLLALDPNHPVAADLSSRLNGHFRSQADDARGTARSAQSAAEQAHARSSSGFSDGLALAREGEAAFGRREYAGAARKWLDARDSFDRARRDVAERTVATAPPAPTTLPQIATTTLPPPTQAAVTLPPPPVVTAPPETVPARTLPPPPVDEEPAIRKTVADYGRAIEQKDLALFKQVKPNLTADEERRLREVFEGSSSDAVRIEVNDLKISGGQATVHLTRKDSIGGRVQTIQQTLLLVKGPGGWTIREIGR